MLQVMCQALYIITATDVHWVIGGEEAIRTEIYLHGPVEAVFNIYEDFYTYKSGIVYIMPARYTNIITGGCSKISNPRVDIRCVVHV